MSMVAERGNALAAWEQEREWIRDDLRSLKNDVAVVRDSVAEVRVDIGNIRTRTIVLTSILSLLIGSAAQVIVGLIVWSLRAYLFG